MKSDNARNFFIVTMVGADSELDDGYCTEAELLRELKENAENHYEDSDEPFSVCVWDVENTTSTIYEYNCEKVVQVTVTAY